MYKIEIDPSLCDAENSCVKICSPNIFVADGDGPPHIVNTELCNRCGHCLAICPKDAISHSGFGDAVFPARPRSSPVKPEELMILMRSRRSTRRFKDKPVPREVMNELIEAARYAPTASNVQDVQYTVIQDRDLIGKIDRRIMAGLLPLFTPDLDPLTLGTSMARVARRVPAYQEGASNLFLYGAPALVVFHAPAKAGLGEENCHYAAMQMVLMAEAMGLGACCMGFLISASRRDAEIQAMIQLPPGRRVGTAYVLGYPRFRFRRLIPRDEAQVAWL